MSLTRRGSIAADRPRWPRSRSWLPPAAAAASPAPPAPPPAPRAAGSNFDYSGLSGTLNGSGSTFQLPFNQAAIAGFQSVAPNVTVNYGGGGSGKGKTDLAERDRAVGRHRQPHQARPTSPSSRAAPSCTSRPWPRRSRLVQPQRRVQDSSSTDRPWARSSRPRSRPGTTRPSPGRQPGCHPAEHAHRGGAPLRRLGHDQQLHPLPDAGRLGHRLGRWAPVTR